LVDAEVAERGAEVIAKRALVVGERVRADAFPRVVEVPVGHLVERGAVPRLVRAVVDRDEALAEDALGFAAVGADRLAHLRRRRTRPIDDRVGGALLAWTGADATGGGH
jgi:hypothetical protein